MFALDKQTIDGHKWSRWVIFKGKLFNYRK